jgi:hypothetical protein
MTAAPTVSSSAGVFLEAAVQIGARLVRDAIWHGETCTWEVVVPDRKNGRHRSPVREHAAGGLYQGSAGIALFLTELSRLTCDPSLTRTAAGALRHALQHVAQPSAHPLSFYSGRVGVAYAAGRLAAIAGRDDLLRLAASLLRPLRDTRDDAFDVIGGAAGAIPALLALAPLTDGAALRELATNLGQELIASARWESVGWSWGTTRNINIRNLTGYAHGASGVGHALLELFAWTGASDLRYAAEQAFLYERQFFDPETGNWPDFRHQALSRYVLEGRIAELREQLGRGEALPPYRLSSMVAWCHGAAGIGAARLRAFEVLRLPVYEREARAAVTTSLGALSNATRDFTLCHGTAGVCETLLLASDILGVHEYRLRAEDVAKQEIERCAAGGEWPCGTLHGLPDPSLLLGEAGIGYHFLRLGDPDTPCFLALGPSRSAPGQPREHGPSRLLHDYVASYWGQAVAVLDRLDRSPWRAVHDNVGRSPQTESEVLRMRRAILAVIAREPSAACRDLMLDASCLEQCRFELLQTVTDFTEPLLRSLSPRQDERLPSPHEPLVLAPHARLVVAKYDWDGWLATQHRDAVPKSWPRTFLVYRHGNRIVHRVVTGLSATVLQCFTEPATPAEVADRIARTVTAAPLSDVASIITRQVHEVYRAGLVVRVGSVVAGATGADVHPIPQPTS